MNLSFIDVILCLAISLIIIVSLAKNETDTKVSKEGYLFYAKVSTASSDLKIQYSDNEGKEYDLLGDPKPLVPLTATKSATECTIIGELPPSCRLTLRKKKGAGIVNWKGTLDGRASPEYMDVYAAHRESLTQTIKPKIKRSVESHRQHALSFFKSGDQPEASDKKGGMAQYIQARLPLQSYFKEDPPKVQRGDFSAFTLDERLTPFYHSFPPLAVMGNSGGIPFYYSASELETKQRNFVDAESVLQFTTKVQDHRAKVVVQHLGEELIISSK